MPKDSQQVAEAIEKMREALALLDHAGAGSTSFAFHLSMALESADRREDTDLDDFHEFSSTDPAETEVGV